MCGTIFFSQIVLMCDEFVRRHEVNQQLYVAKYLFSCVFTDVRNSLQILKPDEYTIDIAKNYYGETITALANLNLILHGYKDDSKYKNWWNSILYIVQCKVFYNVFVYFFFVCFFTVVIINQLLREMSVMDDNYILLYYFSKFYHDINMIYNLMHPIFPQVWATKKIKFFNLENKIHTTVSYKISFYSRLKIIDFLNSLK